MTAETNNEIQAALGNLERAARGLSGQLSSIYRRAGNIDDEAMAIRQRLDRLLRDHEEEPNGRATDWAQHGTNLAVRDRLAALESDLGAGRERLDALERDFQAAYADLTDKLDGIGERLKRLEQVRL